MDAKKSKQNTRISLDVLVDVVLVGALEGNTGTIRRIGIGTNHKALTLGMRSLQQKHEKKNSKKDTLALAR